MIMNVMIRKIFLLTAFVLAASSISSISYGQTRYVSDELMINMRSGQGDQYRIIKMLKSGTRMKIVENGDTKDWVKVEISGGTSGWVRTQYIQNNPAAKQLLAQAEKKLEQLSTQTQSLGNETNSLQTENGQLSEQLKTALTEASQLSEELDELKRISANAVTLNSTNQKLMQERQLLETEIDVIKAENERLSDNSNQTWFLYGAFAVAIGVLITLLVQNIRSKRRYSEWA
ncbi:MAG: TIGR04211 family SH3 domain-containing protein [Cellvibrionaceae bacterium]